MPRDDWFLTYSGRRVYVTEPDPAQVCIDDIAHSLALTCRFGGHSREFYSVAQHSVIVHDIVPFKDRRVGLMHDAAEAYLGDVIRPLKRQLTRYKEIELAWWEAICLRFGLNPALPESVKRADHVALMTERRDVHHWNTEIPWIEDEQGFKPLVARIVPLSSRIAKAEFLDRWESSHAP